MTPGTLKVRVVGSLLAALLAACIVLALIAATALADTYTVGTTADASGACNPTTSPCSLRQVIAHIHSHPFPPDTIIVPAGTYTLTLGQLLINDSMTIEGAGANRTVIEQTPVADRSTMGDRVFDIEAVSGGLTPTVSLSGVEVSGGDANADNPVDQFFGGDIRNSGVLTLTDDWITNGFACSGGGVGNSSGTVTIEQTLISGNHSACSGGDSGGVENFGTPASGTTPDLPGHLVIDDSTIADNDARLVGGVFSWNDDNNTLTITNSTIAGNFAQDESGGLARGPGGGLGLGEGIARVQNTIIADNFEKTGGVTTPTNCAPGPGLTSQGNNIDSGTDCHLHDTIPGQTDQSDTNPLLGPLQNNGGPTMTIAIAPGSPALDRVPRTGFGCPATDQRGVPRPQGTGCDIGAFELQVPPTCAGVTSNDTGAGTVTIGLSCSGTAPRAAHLCPAFKPRARHASRLQSEHGSRAVHPEQGVCRHRHVQLQRGELGRRRQHSDRHDRRHRDPRPNDDLGFRPAQELHDDRLTGGQGRDERSQAEDLVQRRRLPVEVPHLCPADAETEVQEGPPVPQAEAEHHRHSVRSVQGLAFAQ